MTSASVIMAIFCVCVGKEPSLFVWQLVVPDSLSFLDTHVPLLFCLILALVFLLLLFLPSVSYVFSYNFFLPFSILPTCPSFYPFIFIPQIMSFHLVFFSSYFSLSFLPSSTHPFSCNSSPCLVPSAFPLSPACLALPHAYLSLPLASPSPPPPLITSPSLPPPLVELSSKSTCISP